MGQGVCSLKINYPNNWQMTLIWFNVYLFEKFDMAFLNLASLLHRIVNILSCAEGVCVGLTEPIARAQASCQEYLWWNSRWAQTCPSSSSASTPAFGSILILLLWFLVAECLISPCCLSRWWCHLCKGRPSGVWTQAKKVKNPTMLPGASFIKGYTLKKWRTPVSTQCLRFIKY